MVSDVVIATRTFSHMMPDGRVYVAEAKLHQLTGNERPYFSLTGEEWKSQRALKQRSRFWDVVVGRDG